MKKPIDPIDAAAADAFFEAMAVVSAARLYMYLHPAPAARVCFCLWPTLELCNGLGEVECLGCGGDHCVCQCGGRRPCEGCDECTHLQPDPES